LGRQQTIGAARLGAFTLALSHRAFSSPPKSAFELPRCRFALKTISQDQRFKDQRFKDQRLKDQRLKISD
jgi:hypothetical protein